MSITSTSLSAQKQHSIKHAEWRDTNTLSAEGGKKAFFASPSDTARVRISLGEDTDEYESELSQQGTRAGRRDSARASNTAGIGTELVPGRVRLDH